MLQEGGLQRVHERAVLNLVDSEHSTAEVSTFEELIISTEKRPLVEIVEVETIQPPSNFPVYLPHA